MDTKKKKLIRVVFDVRDEMKHPICSDVDLSVAALDPDEAIDRVFAEMQQQFKGSVIHLSRVRICA